jgi:hypothetical protein
MRISFARALVTGVSRQLRANEHWTLYYFENHAATCSACYNPLAVQNKGRQLCDEGRSLACSVASLLFRLREDGHVYAKEDHEYIRIEMPAKYEHVAALFKAIEASKNGILQRARSLDAHYPVQPRTPLHYPVGGGRHAADDYEYDYRPRAAQYPFATAGGRSSRRSSPRSSPRSSQRSSPLSSEAEFPAARWSPRGSRDSGRWSRGSLFDGDQQLEQLRQLRESQLRYRHGPTLQQPATWD